MKDARHKRPAGYSTLSFHKKLTVYPIGQLLVNGGFISEDDLEAALSEQRHTNELLGEILVRMGVLDKAELDAALSVQRELSSFETAVQTGFATRRLLGAILMHTKHITPEQLDFALKEQAETGEKLGEVLVRLGHCTEAELNATLSVQSRQHSVQMPEKFRLGEILVAAGHLTRQQLDHALEHQKGTGRKIGEVLIESGFIAEHHVSAGLSIQRKLLTAALAAALSLSAVEGGLGQASAQTAKATINVSATVKGYAKLHLLHQNAEIVVTHGDVMRGYVDVAAATRIDIESNTSSMLVFQGLDEPFKAIHITGLKNTEVVIHSGIGLVELPYSQPGKFFYVLNYRFMLSENAHAGTYAWPLNISINPA